MSDPDIDPLEIAAFYNKIKEIPKDSYVVISGNMPRFINDNFYAQLVITLKEKGVKVVLDTDGPALRKGVSAGPYLIKPNIHEFGRLVEKNMLNFEEIIEYGKRYQNVVEYCRVYGSFYGRQGSGWHFRKYDISCNSSKDKGGESYRRRRFACCRTCIRFERGKEL